jgi:hypothetical protein
MRRAPSCRLDLRGFAPSWPRLDQNSSPGANFPAPICATGNRNRSSWALAIPCSQLPAHQFSCPAPFPHAARQTMMLSWAMDGGR